MSLRSYTTIQERRTFLETTTGKDLKAIAMYPTDLEIASQRNCENMVGAVQIPVGIAGPLKINGQHASGEYYLPLATTEGALVASVSRGCKAVTVAGGVNVHVDDVGMSRSPVFETKGITESISLRTWLIEHISELKTVAKTTSSHIELEAIETVIVGKKIFVKCIFHTQDAMGMNMVTIATDAIVHQIEKQTGVQCIALAGNFDSDKKPSMSNFLSGRGKRIWAEATIDRSIVQDCLKTTPQRIHEVVEAKCHLGSIVSGSLGYNAHYANIIAAMFIACGQDAAHTVEGSLGITSTEVDDGALYISVYLPDVPLGTVGGGTSLPAQHEMLRLLSVDGGEKGQHAYTFAEIVGSTVLAGELSLLAALAQGTLAPSHQRLARGK